MPQFVLLFRAKTVHVAPALTLNPPEVTFGHRPR